MLAHAPWWRSPTDSDPIGIGPASGWFSLCSLGFLLLSTGMHVFIFLFGIGPYRWNVFQIYLAACSWWLAGGRGHVLGLLPWLGPPMSRYELGITSSALLTPRVTSRSASCRRVCLPSLYACSRLNLDRK